MIETSDRRFDTPHSPIQIRFVIASWIVSGVGKPPPNSCAVVLRVVLNQRDLSELSGTDVTQPCAEDPGDSDRDGLGAGRSEVQILSPR